MICTHDFGLAFGAEAMFTQIRLDGVDESILLNTHQFLATFLRQRLPDVHPIARRRPRLLRLQRVDEASLVLLAFRNTVQHFVALKKGQRERN